jgi:hypothetical protein
MVANEPNWKIWRLNEQYWARTGCSPMIGASAKEQLMRNLRSASFCLQGDSREGLFRGCREHSWSNESEAGQRINCRPICRAGILQNGHPDHA